MKRRWLFLTAGLVVLGLAGLVGYGVVAGFFGPASVSLGPPPTLRFRLDPLGLVRSPQIKLELAITDEQAEKLKEAAPDALDRTLDEKQLSRLHQIELQRRGLPALADADVADALKLTDVQRDSIKTILDDADKERREAFPKGTGGSLDQRMAKVDGIKKAAFAKAESTVFTAPQKKMWIDLNGAPFHLQLPFVAPPKKK